MKNTATMKHVMVLQNHEKEFATPIGVLGLKQLVAGNTLEGLTAKCRRTIGIFYT